MAYDIGLLGRTQLRREASEAKLKVEKLRTLHEIGAAITSSLGVEKVLTRVVEAAVFITNAEEGSLFLLDEDTRELHLRAQKGLGEKYARGFKIRVKDSIAGDVVKMGRPQRLESEGRDLKVVTGYMVYAIVYVPVVIRQEVIGVLSVDNQLADRIFGEDDESLLSILGGYAAIALENARLLEELNRQTRVLTDVYGLDELEPALPVDLDAMGVVYSHDSQAFGNNGLEPEHLDSLIHPYLAAVSEIQHVIDEIRARPTHPVGILAITRNQPVVATLDGVREAVEFINKVVVPRKPELEELWVKCALREKEIAADQAQAQVLEARARAAQGAAEREELLSQAAEQYALLESARLRSDHLRWKLQQARIRLAHELVTQVSASLSTAEIVAHVIRLLPALEVVVSSPFQLSAMKDRRRRRMQARSYDTRRLEETPQAVES
jgi:K+-sensing histidine kinase KdpD